MEIFEEDEIYGMSADGRVWQGYDNQLDLLWLTTEERIKLADMMIARWTEFKRKSATRSHD